MSAHTPGEWRLLCLTVTIVVVQAIAFKRIFWDAPLKNGLGYFLGIKVSPGFYEGEGTRWLQRWRGLVTAANSLAGLAVLGIFASGRWDLFSVWAGGLAVLHVTTFFGFTGYARARLGANPPVLSSVAVPLETRRLSNYISWPLEIFVALITALSWALLLTCGNAQTYWRLPVALSYVIIGVFFFKVGMVRISFPLPADRPEEHHRQMEAQRRYSLRVANIFQWLVVIALSRYSLLHGWQTFSNNTGLRWFVTGSALAVLLYMAVSILRGERRLTAMGRDLRPVGSWSTPFRPARLMTPGFAKWFGIWFGGLLLLQVFFRR